MRLSLVISRPPAANGTLKSTRMKTVLSFKSRSLIDNFDIRSLYVTPTRTLGSENWLATLERIGGGLKNSTVLTLRFR